MDNSGWNAWVFRDGRKLVEGKWLVAGLRASLESLRRAPDRERCVDGLIWAGQLECAIADANASLSESAGDITDALASELLTPGHIDVAPLLSKLDSIHLPGCVHISVPESFAYYALHPLKFAALAEGIRVGERAAVIGIRSIGTTLSAVVFAALRKRGIAAGRTTVRPTGHPYDRRCDFSDSDRAWLSNNAGAKFLIVDEGPGLSGSSFISVGEALTREGVPEQQIVFCGTRCPDPYALRTPNGAARWTRFQSAFTTDAPFLPEGASIPLGGGAWRERFLAPEQRPGSWTQLETLKFLSSDHPRIFRFEGYGRYGQEVGERSKLLADAGFSPRYLGNAEGFGIYDFIAGRAAKTPDDLSTALLERFAEYCAFRARECSYGGQQDSDLERMLRFDWKNEFGVDLGDEACLRTARVTICDGRMLPHEWLILDDGRAMKLDAATHGDDHFFPGPCDIAWDLAGTIVEWELSDEQAEHFVQRYEELSGDRVGARLGAYLLAYAIFRCSYSKMAAKAMGATSEEPLLHRDYLRYRAACEQIYARLHEPHRIAAHARLPLTRLADEPAAA